MTEEMGTLDMKTAKGLYELLRTRVLGKKQGTGIASSADPYHPDYELTNDTRIRAVRIAETAGVEAAAAECNVSVSTVYRWRNAYATSVSNT